VCRRPRESLAARLCQKFFLNEKAHPELLFRFLHVVIELIYYIEFLTNWIFLRLYPLSMPLVLVDLEEKLFHGKYGEYNTSLLIINY
jgi:hypothetical protein